MRLQDDMLRATRRFDAAGRPTDPEERHALSRLQRLDETGETLPDAPPAAPRQGGLAHRWLARVRLPVRAASFP